MSPTKRRGARTRLSGPDANPAEPALNWPGDPETVTAADIDFRAVARVLANTCRHGGRIAAYHSLAGHAVLTSAEVEALDGLAAEDRRVLALHALLADAPCVWIGAWRPGAPAGSQRAAERVNRLAARIERAVREAAGLDPVLAEDHGEVLRFVARMAAAAERRDLDGATGPGIAFPPLKSRIRPLEPDRAARLWLARFEALARPPGDSGAGALKEIETIREEEAGDVANLQEEKDGEAGTEPAGRRNAA